MSGSDDPVVTRCSECGATMEIPSGLHDDGHESLYGRSAKCPRCGYVNVADSSTASSVSAVKDQHMMRRI